MHTTRKNFIDTDTILSGNEEWYKLDEKWGTPIDLDTDDADDEPRLKQFFSTLDLRKSTFNSSFLFKKVKSRNPSKADSSLLAYNEFIQDLEKSNKPCTTANKQFYIINGQMLSALSVEEICNKIDDIFKSVEKLYSATSTIKSQKKIEAFNIETEEKVKPVSEVVKCSISTSDLSFDDTKTPDTLTPSSTNSKKDAVDKCIDEAFEEFNSTVTNINEEAGELYNNASVTTLVRKFTNILKSPVVKTSPRRQRQCCEKFKDLAEFWRNQTLIDK